MFRLLELEVVHWDFWQRFRLPLDAAIITIVGPNGSGKTTLLDALRTLLALECSRKRDYKRYVRRSGEDFCWLRGVVDNQRPQGSSRRPFGLPFQNDRITLACRIDRKGGDWVRKYWVAEGNVPIEAMESQGQEFGVRDYQRLLQSAGLSPAIARVLSLEQGQTDKLTELAPRELLDLVFQVFGDKEVLDRYQEARHHQEATARELNEVERQLEMLAASLEKHDSRVNRYLEWRRLRDEQTALASEVLPRLEYHLLQREVQSARRVLTVQRREWRELRAAKHMLGERIAAQRRLIEEARATKLAAEALEQARYEELNEINRALGKYQALVEQHDTLLAQAAQAGGDPSTDQAALEQLEDERDRLRLQAATLRQEQAATAELLENLAAGRRTDPADVAAFRLALSSADIDHDLLTDLVEIIDPAWQAAVEAVLAPFAHIVLLARQQDAERAFALGEKLRYRHYIVPERTPAPLPTQGSLLEVVRFKKAVPEWLIRLLERTQRVEDAAAGAKLPRAQDWVTRSGYLRERRGARYAAPEQARFGQARIEALKNRLQALDAAIAPLLGRLDALGREIAAIRGRLTGIDAGTQLAARAAEFAEARRQQEALTAQRRAVGEAVHAAREARGRAEATLQAHLQDQNRQELQLAAIERELAQRANSAGRKEQADRIRRLRHLNRTLPAAWRDHSANQVLTDKWRDTTNVRRRIEEIEARFATESWETDESVIALRDKIRADYERQSQELAQRRRDNAMAQAQTDAARAQYSKVLAHSVRRYGRNLRTLGEMAGIRVEYEPLGSDLSDLALAQAGLVVKFDFDEKGLMGLNDGDASGGQQVMKSLILLVALMMEESRPGGFVFIDEPFAHLDIVNIERVAAFLKATRAQYLLTTPVTHNVNVYDPAMLTLVTFKKRPGETWAPRVGVLVRDAANDGH
ncbi:AAA family ATPase [Thiobacter aerophilum]|uniref:AAA family ATPase n=1 Tax=Thiobacter aerophilum TaxID=3121275 RepID=A0ABV0EBZ9_9BURK